VIAERLEAPARDLGVISPITRRPGVARHRGRRAVAWALLYRSRPERALALRKRGFM